MTQPPPQEHDHVVIRRMRGDDWEAFARMRLRALKIAPGVFHASFEDECKNAEADWRRTLSNPRRAVFGLYSHHHLIGITGIEKGDWSELQPEHSAVLWGSWIEPEWRGKGFSNKLFEARLDWAESHPEIERLLVGVREDNTASIASVLRHGFHRLRHQPVKWHDGKTCDIIVFEKRLHGK